MIMSRLFFYLPVLFVMLGLPAETFANQKFGGVLLSPNGEARGVFTLTPAPGGLLVTANLKNMPEGQHAFHLHANPSCEDSFNAAGGHYNPKGEPHGFFSGKAFHLGDMPNILSSSITSFPDLLFKFRDLIFTLSSFIIRYFITVLFRNLH